MHKNSKVCRSHHRDSDTDGESLPLAFLVYELEAHGHTSCQYTFVDLCSKMTILSINLKHIHIRMFYQWLDYIHLSKL